MLDHRTETFMTVCNVMNYREAAELLHITQPAVTQHIQFLEKEYGCRFFLYENRKLIKTPAAEMLEEHLRSAQQRENFLREKFKNSFFHVPEDIWHHCRILPGFQTPAQYFQL